MAQAKQLDGQLAKVKFCCGEQVFYLSITLKLTNIKKASLADFAIYSAVGGIDAKTRGKSLQAFCARMEQL